MQRFFVPLLAIGLASCVHQTNIPQEIALASGATISAEELSAALLDASKKADVNGFSVAVINDSKIVYHRNFGVADVETKASVTDDTLFELASMSKPVFGALVVKLASDGHIDLDKPLASYLRHPDLPENPRATIFTARHVLTHQSGLPNWRKNNPDNKLDIAFEPGTSRRYSGEGYEYLADVLMHILGTDDRGLDAIFQKDIADPAGSRDSLFVQDNERVRRKATGYFDGIPFSGDIDYTKDGFGASYSIHSTAKDYGRLMIGLMRGPSLNAEQRATFFAPQNVPIPADDPDRALGLTDQALGYAIYDLPLGRFYVHGGNNEGFSSMSAMQPNKGWAFVIVANENQAADFQLSSVSLMLGLDSPEGQ